MADPTGGARGETRAEELTRAQTALVRRVAEARATVPDLTLEAEADITSLPAEPALLDRVLRATAAALRAHPRANGSYRDGGWELHERVNVAVALEREASFVLPVIRDADGLGAEEIGATRRALADRVAGGTVTSPELAGATFTVWEAGPGVARLVPVPVPGQAGALGVGAARPAAVVRDGTVSAGVVTTLTLVGDHRILFGATAAAFLADVVRGLAVS